MKRFLLGLLLCFPCFAVVAHVGSTHDCKGDGFTVTTVACTPAASATSGNIIAATVGWQSSTITLSSIALTGCIGGSFTLLDNPTTQGTGRAAQGYVKVTSSATCTITATFSSAVTGGITAQEISGTDTTTFLDGGSAHKMAGQASPGTGANAVTTGNITTSTNGDYLYSGVSDVGGNSITFTVGTGYTIGTADSAFTATEWQVQSTASASTAATYTSSLSGANPTITGIMAFAPAGAGGAVVRQFMTLGVGR